MSLHHTLRTLILYLNRNSHSVRRYNVLSERVKATFVVSELVDWARDIQVLPHSVMNLWTVSSSCIIVFHLEAGFEIYFLFNFFFISLSLFSALFWYPCWGLALGSLWHYKIWGPYWTSKWTSAVFVLCSWWSCTRLAKFPRFNLKRFLF